MTIDQAEPPAAPSCDRCPHCKLVAEDPDGELRHSTRMSFEFEVYHELGLVAVMEHLELEGHAGRVAQFAVGVVGHQLAVGAAVAARRRPRLGLADGHGRCRSTA